MSYDDFRLGESFSLYIRYANEMEYFGWEEKEEQDLSWLPEESRENFCETVEKIYEEAHDQFKGYLKHVHKNINDRISNFATIRKARLQGDELCEKQVMWNIWRKGMKKPKKDLCQIGGFFGLDEAGEYYVNPWIWVSKAKGDEKRLQKIVGENTRRFDEVAGFKRGTVILGCESIRLKPRLGCEPALVEALAGPFIALEGKKWQRILDLAYKGK